MTALAYDGSDEVQYRLTRPGGGSATCVRSQGSIVVHVDLSDAAPVPAGAQLLVDFLDEFEADPAIARELPGARRRHADELIARQPGVTGLKELRLKAGLSQAELAAALGSSQSRVSQIEAGHQKPGYENIVGLARILGVDYNGLMEALSRG